MALITLCDYNVEWPQHFEQEAACIRGALDKRALLIEHVGSTAIPGLIAKPIIDIVVEVADSANEPAYVPGLKSVGYELVIREPEWHQHRLFKRFGVALNLHVFSEKCAEVQSMLTFRDRLRTDSAECELYAAAKRELAQRRWKRVQDYADAKADVIATILRHAREAASR